MAAVYKARLTTHDEAKHILIDAIKSEDQELVRSFEEEVRKLRTIYLEACLKQPSSPAMLGCMLSICDPLINHGHDNKLKSLALKLKNPEYLKLLLQHGLILQHHDFQFTTAASTRSPEMFRFLATIEPHENTIEPYGNTYVPDINYRFLELIIPEKPDVMTETATLECLEIIKDKLNESCLDHCLIFLAQRCHTRSIALFCLENGANVNVYLPRKSKSFTPLWCASYFDTREAAELMKLLLTHGANPDLRYSNTSLSDRPGPRNISKWFGMGWNDFVKDCRRVQ